MSEPHDPHAVCPICEHAYDRSKMNKHHLVPKSRKGKVTVLMCKTCHSQIHAVYTEKELAARYGTLEELLAAEEFRPWVEWIRKRKPTARIRVKTSRRKRR